MSKSIVQRFVPIFGSRVLGVLVTLLATPIIVRFLGTKGYGEYAFLLSILSILVLLVNAGIYDGIRKFLKESDHPDDWEDRVFAFYTQIGFVLALVVSGVLYVAIATDVVAEYVGARFELLLALVAITVISRQAFSISRSTLMGFDREDVSERYQVYNKMLAVVAGLVLLAFGWGIEGLFAGMILGNVVTAGLGFFRVARHVDYGHLASVPGDETPRGRLLRFNVLSVLLFALFVSIKHVDILLIQTFLGSQQTGFYKAALNLAEFVWFVPRIIQTTLLHSTSELWSQDESDRITNISATVTRYTLLFTGLLIVGLGVLAEPTVTVYYGAAFEPAVEPLLLLLPGAMGFAVARPILAIGQGKGQFKYLIYATAGAAVLNLVLNVLLIPRYGIIGAAVATSIGYFSMLVFHVASARAIGFDPIDDLRLPNVVLTGVLATPVIFLLATRIDSIYLLFAVVPPVGFVVYMGGAVAVGALSVDELRDDFVLW